MNPHPSHTKMALSLEEVFLRVFLYATSTHSHLFLLGPLFVCKTPNCSTQCRATLMILASDAISINVHFTQRK